MRIDKLTTKLQEALADAQSLALKHDNASIESAHLVLALLEQHDSVAPLLQRSGVDIKALTKGVNVLLDRLPKTQSSEQVQVGREVVTLLQLAEKESMKRGDQFVASELFFYVLSDHKSDCAQICRDHGLNKAALDVAIKTLRGGESVQSANSEGQREALHKYCVDLTERAKKGKLDPVIGRDDEIRRAIQVLQRRTKNNPVLIGEPGVGKTAIVEGLAKCDIDDPHLRNSLD